MKLVVQLGAHGRDADLVFRSAFGAWFLWNNTVGLMQSAAQHRGVRVPMACQRLEEFPEIG